MVNGVFSMDLLRELMRSVKDAPPAPLASPLMFGMPVRSSSAFPHTSYCSRCGGTGSGGEESTYCQHCKGGGRIRYEGAIVEQAATVDWRYGRGPTIDPGKMTVIASYFPRKFEPSFPFALPLRPWRGFALAPIEARSDETGTGSTRRARAGNSSKHHSGDTND